MRAVANIRTLGPVILGESVRRLWLFVCLTAAALIATASARADDGSAEFSGFYVGLNTGYGFGASGDWCFCTFLPSITDSAGGEGGIFAGVEGGYDIRWGPLLIEAAARLSHADLAFSENCATGALCSGELAWLGEAQMSAGLLIGKTLVAGTVGYAIADVEAQVGASPPDTSLHDGRIYAARIERGMSGGWRMGVEYRYFEMDGTHDAPADTKVEWTAHALSLVIHYEVD